MKFVWRWKKPFVAAFVFVAICFVTTAVWLSSQPKPIDMSFDAELDTQRAPSSVNTDYTDLLVQNGVYPELITYTQFLNLPPEKQTEYINGLQDLLVELSEMKNGKGFAASAEVRRSIEDILLKFSVPIAEAQGPDAQVNGDEANPGCVSRGLTRVYFDRKIGTCVIPPSGVRLNECPSYARRVGIREGMRTWFRCVPPTAWRELATSRQNQLSDPNGAAPLTEVKAHISVGNRANYAQAIAAQRQREAAREQAPRNGWVTGDERNPTCQSQNIEGLYFDRAFGTCVVRGTGRNSECHSSMHRVSITVTGNTTFRCVPDRAFRELSNERRSQLAAGGASPLREVRAEISIGNRPGFSERIAQQRAEEQRRAALPQDGWVMGNESNPTCQSQNLEGLEFNRAFGTCVVRPTGRNECRPTMHLASVRVMNNLTHRCVPARAWAELSNERRGQLESSNGAPPLHEVKAEISIGNRTGFSERIAQQRTEEQQRQARASETQTYNNRLDAADRIMRRSNSCQPVLRQCAEARAVAGEGYVENYRRNQTQCIYAGNVRNYQGQYCERVSSTTIGGTNYDCGGRALCNPLVFGVQANGRPYCVTRSATVTRACQQAASGATNRPQGADEEWNSLRSALNSLCYARRNEPESSYRAAYFCEECGIIISRIGDLNARTSGPNWCLSALIGDSGRNGGAQ